MCSIELLSLQNGISELVCVGRRHYKAPGVIVLMSFNDVNSHIICKFRLHSSFVWSFGTEPATILNKDL